MTLTRPERIAMLICTFLFIFSAAGTWNARLAEIDTHIEVME